MSIVVEVIADDDLASVNRLIPQLSRSAPPLTAEALKQIVLWDGNRLLIARDGNQVVGMLTLVMFPIPTGLRAWIEDVVVDEAARGKGAGAALPQKAVRLAEAAGARTVDLTSPLPAGGQPAVRTARVRTARHQGLPLRQPALSPVGPEPSLRSPLRRQRERGCGRSWRRGPCAGPRCRAGPGS